MVYFPAPASRPPARTWGKPAPGGAGFPGSVRSAPGLSRDQRRSERLIGLSLKTTHATTGVRPQVAGSAGVSRPGLSVGSVKAAGSSLAWNSFVQSASDFASGTPVAYSAVEYVIFPTTWSVCGAVHCTACTTLIGCDW